MYDRLLYLYQEKRVTESQLGIAVSKGWITTEQKTQIIASVSTEPADATSSDSEPTT